MNKTLVYVILLTLSSLVFTAFSLITTDSITSEEYSKGKLSCSSSGVESFFVDDDKVMFYCFNGDVISVARS